MATKARYKPEDLEQQQEPTVAVLPGEQPTSPFLDPTVAQAEPQGSELYNLGTVQQRAASTQDADMFMPSYMQAPRKYPTGAEGSATRPPGASPMLYPGQAEAQPRVRARYTPEEALALAEANRPKRYSPDQILDVAAETMFDQSQPPLPKELWKVASQRRAEMVNDGRLPMEFGQIDSLKDGIVWAANSLYGVGSYIVSAPIAAAASYAASPIESQRQIHATAAATVKRLSTEFGLQTYQDIFNLTHEPKYRVKETGQFVAVNKTGLPLVLPAASGGNNVISGDGIISPVTPEAGIRQFAKEGMTLVPTTEQDLEDYRYGQYLDRMAIGAQSIEDMKAKAPPELLSALASGRWDSVEPNQAQTELALLAAQAAIPVGGSARTWGVGRRVAGGLSKAAEKVEAIAGFPVDVDTALRAKFVKSVTQNTGADAAAQKTAMQAAIDAAKTTGKAGGIYGVALGVSAFEGTPSEVKDLAWTAANLYSGYKGGMYVARQLRAASGFTKTVLKEVADPGRGLDVGARAAVAANPAVPQAIREVLENPSRYRAMESTPARLAKNSELGPTSRAIFGKLSDYRFVQAARMAKDTAAGVPKGITLNAPFIAGALASDDPERAGQMIAAGGLFGAVGGAATRFTEANVRRGEEATSDIARMLVDIQSGNELGSGLGGEILRNRVRPGTKFQEGERGFVMPEQEVASFLTEMEMAGADVAAFVQGKSFDELAQWAAYQGFFRDKVDLIPLNAADYKLNAEANGQNGSGAYFLQPSEGRRARIFVNAESRRNGLAPHEYGHAVLRGGALSPDQIDAVHADINSRYTPDALKLMAGEYAAGMVRAENVKAGIDIDPSPAAIEAKVQELTQGSMVKGSADGLDWLREEIFAEEFRNANIDFARARRNIPLGANPVSFMENLLGAQSRALHMAGIDIDPQTGKPMGRDQIFKENRVAAGDPVVMKNYEAYVKQWRQWIKDPTHEADPGVAVSKTGNVQDTANNPNVTWRNYGGGRMENEFGVKNPDGTVTPKDWKRDIKPTVRARQQAVREMSNRSKQVASADDPTFGMRTRRDGRREVSGRVLPDLFFYIPQYKPFHGDIRRIVAADNAGETLQVRYFAKGKSKDVFKDGIRGVNAVNREAMHGNFVAKKDGTLMWGYLDMTQFRNRAMKAIADRNPALEPYNWDFKALMDDLPTHLRDQASGRGGAVTVGPDRAAVLNGLIGIGTGPLVGAFGKGTAYKTIHLDSIDAIVPTGKQGGQFDVYRANRNAMPDDPKPPVDMDTELSPLRGAAMPDTPRNPADMPSEQQPRGQAMPDKIRAYRGISKSQPFNDSGTTWLTTSRDAAESYATEVHGYLDPAVLEVLVDPSDIPVYDIRRLSEKQLNALDPDEFGNPQKIGIYHNSDDSMLGGSGAGTVLHVPRNKVTVVGELQQGQLQATPRGQAMPDVGSEMRSANPLAGPGEPDYMSTIEAVRIAKTLVSKEEFQKKVEEIAFGEPDTELGNAFSVEMAAREIVAERGGNGGNRGQAMPDVGPVDAPPFYLKSAAALDTKIQGKQATPDQVKAILTNPQNGIKPEELKWTGVMQEVERLAKENNGKVPKDALMRYLAEDGAVRLEEVTLGDLTSFERARMDSLPPNEAMQVARDADSRATKYGQYQLPGGENYREVVLAMPLWTEYVDARKIAAEQGFGPDDPLPQHVRDQIRSRYDAVAKEREAREYNSGHFPNVKNYVAHMRLNERTDAAGKPGLFIEEIQSDRHQAGREHGYKEPFEQWIAYYDANGTEVPIGYGRSEKQALESIDKNWEGLVKIQTRKRDGVEGVIPDAPFRTSWPLQMFKRALRDAVDSGKEWVGWTTGETQAARYDLSRQVDSISVSRGGGEQWEIWADKDGRQLFNNHDVSSIDQVATIIGKDLAAKVADMKPGETARTFSGLDLKVGGEGMKGFYDQILPKEISKYVKQWGAQVEKGRMGKEPSAAFKKAVAKFEEAKRKYGPTSQQATDAMMAIPNESGGPGIADYWRVNITPQMRSSLKKAGQALFVGGVAAVTADQVTEDQ